MKRSKGFIFLVMVMALTLIMVACGGQASVQSTAPSSTGAQSAESSLGKEPVTIVVEHIVDDGPALKEIKKLFEVEYPYITVELVEIPNAEFREKITVQLSAGEDIDIFWGGNHGEYADSISMGQCYPLDELIKRDNLDITNYHSNYDSMKCGGSVYALPNRCDAAVLFYNKELFDQAGVEYPQGNMSYEAFRELAKKMSWGEGDSKVWGAFVHKWPICWERPAIQAGATTIDSDLSLFKDALQMRLDMEADGSIMKYPDQIAISAHYRTMFEKGNVAMVIMGDYLVGQLRAEEAEGNMDFDWDIVACPIPEGCEPNTTTGMPSGFCMNANTKKVDAAWEFLKFAAGPEGAKCYAQSGYMPGWVDEDVRSIMAYDGKTKPANIGILLDQKVYEEYPAVAGISQVEAIYKEEAELTFAGEQTVDETMENIARRISELDLNKD